MHCEAKKLADKVVVVQLVEAKLRILWHTISEADIGRSFLKQCYKLAYDLSED